MTAFCSRALSVCTLLAVLLASAPSRAAEGAAAQLQALARDMTFRWAQLHPFWTNELGIPGEDGQLDRPSLAADARDLKLIRNWKAQLAAIPVAGQPLRIRDDALLLRARLVGMERQLTVYKIDRRDYSAPGTAVLGVTFVQFRT
jgi:hypothetical protein